MRNPQTRSSDSSGMATTAGDCGQAIMLVLIAVALIATVAISMATVAAGMTDRSAAQAAADAAALAGAIDGRDAAETVAKRNGARLVSFDLDRNGVDVTVSVQVRIAGQVASAKASTASRSSP